MLQSFVKQGMPTRHLARAMARVDESLAEYGGIIVLGNEVAVRNSDGSIADSQGQTLLDFYKNSDEFEGKIIDFKTDSESRIDDALAAEGEEEYERAEKLYLEILLHDGPTPERCYSLGNVLYQLNRKPEAIQRFRQTIELEPDFLEAWTNLGLALSDVGRTDDALEVLKNALNIAPDFADAIYLYAHTLEHAGRKAEAFPIYESYLRIDPFSTIADQVRIKLSADRA